MNFAAVFAAPVIKCPSCRGTHLRRSRWDEDDSILVPLVLSPYRCIACDKRFYTLSSGTVSLLRGTALCVIVLATILGITYVMNRERKAPQAAAMHLSQAARNDGALQLPARAMAGDAQPQFELGIRYLMGDGAPKDHAEALKWLEMAANGGHAGARYNLGVMYRTGFGVTRDDGTAHRWLDLAARQHHADAQFQIALLHKEGAAVPLDLVKSYTWAHLSASQGHIGAIALRENLRHALTPQQVEDGQDKARSLNAGADKPATPLLTSAATKG